MYTETLQRVGLDFSVTELEVLLNMQVTRSMSMSMSMSNAFVCQFSFAISVWIFRRLLL